MQSLQGSLRTRARWRSPAQRRGISLTALIEPYADAVLNVPPALHLSYATCIVWLAIGLKLAVSAPFAVWARTRTDRMRRLAEPELARYMRARGPIIAHEYARQRRSPQDCQRAIQQAVRGAVPDGA